MRFWRKKAISNESNAHYLRIENLIVQLAAELRYLLAQTVINSSRAGAPNFTKLWDAEFKIFSQFGEDGILDYLCQSIGLSKPKVLEIGAGNFTECNSRFLAEFRNASVFAVDNREDLMLQIENTPLRWKNHIFGLTTWVTTQNISSIVAQAREKLTGLDIFSLDLDGNDYWVLEKCDLQGVSIVVVEYNPLFGSKKSVSVIKDERFDRTQKHSSWLYCGASLKAFESLLRKKGFQFIGSNRVGNNAFFLQNDLLNKFELELPVDLDPFTDWRIRESRDSGGQMNYLGGDSRLEQIKDMVVIDVETLDELRVGDLVE